MPDWKSWAQRRVSRGGHPPSPDPVERQAPTQQAPEGTPPAPAPPGYAWLAHPQMGFVLMPLQSIIPPPVIPAPAHQPQGTQSFLPRPQNGHASMVMDPTERPLNTSLLVRPASAPAGQDPEGVWAAEMARAPDLAGPSRYDAINGNPDPAVLQELRSFPEFHFKGPGAEPGTPLAGAPQGYAAALK
jgi:hypothetical protein